MNLPEQTHLSYIVVYEAWYWRALNENPSISVVASYPGGCAWEFALEQVPLQSTFGTRLKIFDDAWDALVQIPEFFVLLAERGKGATLDDVRSILDRLGAKDETVRQSPYEKE